MNIKGKLRNIIKLIRIKSKISFGDILILLENATNKKPVVAFKKNKIASIYGIENDYLFELALSDGILGNEPHFEQIAKLMINKNSNILDIGANIGTHSILLSKISTNGKIYSFEPQSLVYSILQNNLLINNCLNVVSYKFALTNSNNNVISMEAFSYSGNEINNGSIRLDSSDVSKGDLVLTRSIDSFDFPKIDFIKIDIQGSEFEALCGAESLINRDKPVMFIEIEEHHLRALGTSSKELIEKIFSMGYVLFRVETNYPCDHLCIPIEHVLEFEEKITPNISYDLTKLHGKKIELKFGKTMRNNYESFTIIN